MKTNLKQFITFALSSGMLGDVIIPKTKKPYTYMATKNGAFGGKRKYQISRKHFRKSMALQMKAI